MKTIKYRGVEITFSKINGGMYFYNGCEFILLSDAKDYIDSRMDV